MAKQANKQTAEITEDQPKQTNENFVNPFIPGVTYSDFVKALGSKSIAEYCKGELTDSEIEWLEIEITNYKNK